MKIYPSSDFMKEVEEMFKEDETDWEGLSKNLQKALLTKIEENKHLKHIIQYLEEKLGLDTIRRS